MSLRNLKGLLASAALAVALAVVADGCSSSSATSDLDAAAEASHPPPRHPDGSFDTGPSDDGGGDASGAYDGTTGQKCMTDADCSPTGLGINKCTIANFFTGGPIFPTPVCMPSVTCNAGTDNLIHFCDGPDIQTSPGVCVPSRTALGSGTCFPKCLILADGSAPVGCQGLDTCEVVAWGLTTFGQPIAIGRCIGGCAADADCPTGSKCQKNEGVCLTVPTTPTKQLGQTCSANDPVGSCPCFQNPSTGLGYCTQFCVVGPSSRAACPSGYACDSQLPAQIASSVTDASVAGFTMQNVGLSGSCLQSCGGGGAADSGANSAADAGSDSGADAVGQASSEAGSDGAGTGQVVPSCPVTANCSMMDTVGPVCFP